MKKTKSKFEHDKFSFPEKVDSAYENENEIVHILNRPLTEEMNIYFTK